MNSPYPLKVCKECRKIGKRDKVETINSMCFKAAPFHYQASQKLKYTQNLAKEQVRLKKYAAKQLEKQKEKVYKKPSVRIELPSGEEGTLDGRLIQEPKPAAKIRKVSVKRAEQNRRYTILRKEYLEEFNACRAGLKGCTGQATEIHHRKGRIGDLLLDVKYFLAVCRECHNWIESHSSQAKVLGLSVSRLSKAS